MRKLFRFLFRHDWEVSKKDIGYDRAFGVTTMFVCKSCGVKSTPFPILDRQLHDRIHQERGCPGK